MAAAIEEPALIFGNSLGGWHALMYADYHPEELKGLILVSPAGAPPTPKPYQDISQIFYTEITARYFFKSRTTPKDETANPLDLGTTGSDFGRAIGFF